MQQPNTWKRQPQEQDGDYWFDGKIFLTTNVNEVLLKEDILSIVLETIVLAQEKKGLDYLQVWVNHKGEKLFFINKVTKTDLKNGEKTYSTIRLTRRRKSTCFPYGFQLQVDEIFVEHPFSMLLLGTNF